jgi:hypothetical protein
LDDRLLVINLDGRGPPLLQTIWELAGDGHGRRRTDIEAVTDQALLQRRLAELVGKIFKPITPAAAA